MKVVVDWDLCEGNAYCVKAAPAVFRVDEKDMLQILLESPPEEQRARVERAVRTCPKRAIKIVEE
ncbi:MAG: ferredoxin [Polyangiales bacterium]